MWDPQNFLNCVHVDLFGFIHGLAGLREVFDWSERKLLKPIYECRCNGRLQTKGSTRLSHTGLVVELEDLKIKTRLTNEKFVSVKGECEI